MKDFRFHIVIATTLFATLLWISISMRENYQVQINAPLVIENLPPGKAISTVLPRVVQLTFDDIGWKLAKLLWKTDLRWVVDLNTLPASQHTLTLNDFVEQIGTRVGIQPSAMKPESFPISLDSVIVKKMNVVPNLSLSFRDGYGRIGKVVLHPESVFVRGARSLVRSFSSWPTSKQTFRDIRQSIDVTLPLADTLARIVTLSPGEVNLHIEVQQFADKVFNAVPIELLSTPQNREVILSSPRIDLVLRGGIQQLADIDQSNIRAVVDYRRILADTSGIIEPAVSVPDGIQIVRKTPDRLQYVVRKK